MLWLLLAILHLLATVAIAAPTSTSSASLPKKASFAEQLINSPELQSYRKAKYRDKFSDTLLSELLTNFDLPRFMLINAVEIFAFYHYSETRDPPRERDGDRLGDLLNLSEEIDRRELKDILEVAQDVHEQNDFIQTNTQLTDLKRFRYSDYRDEFYEELVSELLDGLRVEFSGPRIIEAVQKFAVSRVDQPGISLSEVDVDKLQALLTIPQKGRTFLENVLSNSEKHCTYKDNQRREMKSYVDAEEMEKLLVTILTRGDTPNKSTVMDAIRKAKKEVMIKRIVFQTNHLRKRYDQKFQLKYITMVSDRVPDMTKKLNEHFKNDPLPPDNSENYRYYNHMKRLFPSDFNVLGLTMNDEMRAIFNDFSWAEMMEFQQLDSDRLMIRQLIKYKAGPADVVKNAVLRARRLLDVRNALKTERFLAASSIFKSIDYDEEMSRQLLEDVVYAQEL